MNYRGAWTVADLTAFVKACDSTLVKPFEGRDALMSVFGNQTPGIFFVSDSETDFSTAFRTSAGVDSSSTGKKLLWFTSNFTKTEDGKRFSAFLGAKPESGSEVWIVQPGPTANIKYKYVGPMTEAGLKHFVA